MKISTYTIARVVEDPMADDMREAYWALPQHSCVSLARAVSYVLDDAEQINDGKDLPNYRSVLVNATNHFGALSPDDPSQSRDPFEIVVGRWCWLIGLTWLDTSNRPDGTVGHIGNPTAQEEALRRAVERSHREFHVGPIITEEAVTGRVGDVDEIPKESIEKPLAPSATEVCGVVEVPGEAPLNNNSYEES